MYILAVARMHDALHPVRSTYTNIIMVRIDPSAHQKRWLLNQLANSLQAVAQLQEMGFPQEHGVYLERMLYDHLPSDLATWLRDLSKNALERYAAAVAGHVLTPEYLWRTGPNAGKTTLEIMAKSWHAHHQEAN